MNYKGLTEELTKDFCEILEKEYEGWSAGKAVIVRIKTTYPKLGVLIKKIEIDEKMLSKKNKEILQDLIADALTNAINLMDYEFLEISKKFVNSLKTDGLGVNLDSLLKVPGNGTGTSKGN